MSGPPIDASTEAIEARLLAACRQWLERAVIGLNLCPFARAPHVGGRIRWVVSLATDSDALTRHLLDELELLRAADPSEVETTLLLHPKVLADFDRYLDFIDVAEGLVQALGFAGELQVASFHPDYVFAGSDADDPANLSNRSPVPLLHLLREDSISRIVDAGADVDSIPERNQARLRALGAAGWAALMRGEH